MLRNYVTVFLICGPCEGTLWGVIMRKLALLELVFVLAVPVGAQATIIAADGFDYVAGTLGGKGSAADPGWSGPWSGNVAVKDGGNLSYTDTEGNQLVTAGKGVQTTPSSAVFSYREFQAPLPITAPQDVYLSFLMDNYNVGNLWSGISLYHDSTELFFMGKPGNTPHVGVEVPGGSLMVSNDSFSDPLFFVIVLQLVSNGTETQALFFLNPGLDSTLGLDSYIGNTSWSATTINRIRIAGETGVMFDELRIGTTYSDVSPFVSKTAVPEPATIFLLGCGLAGLAGIRKKF